MPRRPSGADKKQKPAKKEGGTAQPESQAQPGPLRSTPYFRRESSFQTLRSQILGQNR